MLNYCGVAAPTPAELAGAAARVLTFIDLGGHEKYLKTALYGLTCMLPDYALLCVSALAGVQRMTRQHLAVLLALGIPFAVAITKADAADGPRAARVASEVAALLAAAGMASGPVAGEADAAAAAAALYAGRDCASEDGSIDGPRAQGQAPKEPACLDGVQCASAGAQPAVPVFHVSSVSGAGLAALHAFLRSLQSPAARRGRASAGGGAEASATGAAPGGCCSKDGTADVGGAAAAKAAEGAEEGAEAGGAAGGASSLCGYDGLAHFQVQGGSCTRHAVVFSMPAGML